MSSIASISWLRSSPRWWRLSRHQPRPATGCIVFFTRVEVVRTSSVYMSIRGCLLHSGGGCPDPKPTRVMTQSSLHTGGGSPGWFTMSRTSSLVFSTRMEVVLTRSGRRRSQSGLLHAVEVVRLHRFLVRRRKGLLHAGGGSPRTWSLSHDEWFRLLHADGGCP